MAVNSQQDGRWLRDIGLAIRRLWNQFPAGPLSSYLGQLGLPSYWGIQPVWLGLRWGGVLGRVSGGR